MNHAAKGSVFANLRNGGHLTNWPTQVASKLARDHALAMAFVAQGGLDAVLAAPQATAFAGQVPRS